MAGLLKIRTCFPTAATINVNVCHCSVSRVGVRVHPAAALLAARGRGAFRRPGTLPMGEYTIVVTHWHIQYSSRDREFKLSRYSWTTNTLSIRLPINR